MSESYIKKVVAGGIQINEIIREYKVASGQTITAGTFVDFQLDTLGNELTYTAPRILSSSPYQNNQILVYRLGSGFSIVTVTDGGLTFGSNFQEISGLNSIKISKIEGNRFFITYEQNSNSSFARILDVGTQTLGAAVQLFFTTTTRYHVHDIINSTKAVVGSGNSNGGIQIAIANISGTTITLSGATTLTTSTSGQITVKSINGFIVAQWRNSNTANVQTRSFSESGGILTTVTNETNLLGSNTSGLRDYDASGSTVGSVIHQLTSTLFIIFYSSGNSLQSVVMNINSSGAISYGTQNSSIITSYNSVGTIRNIGNNQFVTWYHTGDAYSSSIRFFEVNSTGVVTLGNVANFNHGNETKEVRLTNIEGKALVTFEKQTAGQFARIFFEQTLITSATGGKFSGLAKTSGTAGQTIEVYTNV
jgi:hypothetical protein